MNAVMPLALHDQAADNLRFIRATMARAGRFAAVPGWGAAAMGITALVTAALAGPPAPATGWLAWWLGDAAVAATIGVAAMVRKARRLDSPLDGAPARQFALALIPALAVGLVLTIVFVQEGLTARLPGCWLVCYGAAVMAAGVLSLDPVRFVGAAMFVTGVVAFASPPAWGNAYMAVGFGVFQIAGGIAIGRAHHG